MAIYLFISTSNGSQLGFWMTMSNTDFNLHKSKTFITNFRCEGFSLGIHRQRHVFVISLFRSYSVLSEFPHTKAK